VPDFLFICKHVNELTNSLCVVLHRC